MRQWNVGDGLDFCHVQYPEVGLPLVEPIQGIVIGAEEVRHPALPSNGAVEHATKCDTIDRAGMDAEANDPARVLIHDHQNPVGPPTMPTRTGTDPCSRGCLSCGPGRSARRDRRSSVPAGSDGRESFAPRLCPLGCGTPRRSVERFADSPSWDYVASFRRPHERVLRSVLSGRASGGASMRTTCGIFACSWLCEWLAVSRASVRLQNGSDGLNAPRMPSSPR